MQLTLTLDFKPSIKCDKIILKCHNLLVYMVATNNMF